MGDFHQSNRVIKEKYRQELFDQVTKQVRPEKFSSLKTTNPQEFYLSFKNCVGPIINTEVQRIEKNLTPTSDSHLLLLKISTLVDTILQAAFDSSIWLHNLTLQKQLHKKDIPIAIIARGGYGREEIYLQSNIDVQIISSNDQTGDTKKIVKHLEYLFVHQNIFQTSTNTSYTSLNSLERELNEGRIADLCSLLEGRLIAGDSETYSQTLNIVKKISTLKKDNLISYCQEHKNYYDVSNTVFQQEPNVKEELSRLYWALVLARLQYDLKNTNQFELLDELLKNDLISSPAFKNIQSSFAFLSKVRFFLHFHQKGSYRDMMSYEVRGKIAQSMGYTVKEFFHKYFYEAAYPLKKYSRNIFWESLKQDTRKVKNLSKNFALNSQNQIILDNDPSLLFSQNPIRIFKIFAWISEKNYYLSYPIVRSIEDHVDQMCPIFINKDSQKEVKLCFKRIINGKYFSKSLRLLHEFGLLANFYIPEFKNICGLLQDIYVHHFPTDIHVLSALDILNDLDVDENTDPFLRSLYHSIRDKTTLKLSVLLHDIGKGIRSPGQNEEILGAQLVPAILENLGYAKDSRRVKDVSFLVEKHLMMHDLLLLDPEEDETYDMIWDLVNNDIERLKMLLLLTYSDRGGTKMKMSLSQIEQLKIFYQHTLYHKKRQAVPGPIKADFLKMVRLPRDMQSHLEIYSEFCRSNEAFACELLFKPAKNSELIICSKDRPNLLYSFSAVLAFNKLNIVEANIHTLRDHVFDVFKVVNSTGAPIDYSDIFALQNQIKGNLKRVYVDQEPLSQIFKNQSFPISQEKAKAKEIKLKVKLIGRSIKVETHDLHGTFMILTGVFSHFKMEVQRAVLDTREGTASNIFYMRPKDVRYIIENKAHFLRTLKLALEQLVNTKEIFLQETSISAIPDEPTFAL